jgi:putative flippase GtrA
VFIPAAGHGAEVVVLTIANVAATLVKFVLFRVWVFRSALVQHASEVSR